MAAVAVAVAVAAEAAQVLLVAVVGCDDEAAPARKSCSTYRLPLAHLPLEPACLCSPVTEQPAHWLSGLVSGDLGVVLGRQVDCRKKAADLRVLDINTWTILVHYQQ